MTRIVSIFFAAVAFLMAVYWVVPGANPPAMVAVAPSASPQPQTVVLLPPPGVQPVPVAAPAPPPAAVVAAPAAAVATALPSVARVAARTPAGCTGDPIACMLEGKVVAEDAADVTGSIVAPRHRTSAAARPAKVVR